MHFPGGSREAKSSAWRGPGSVPCRAGLLLQPPELDPHWASRPQHTLPPAPQTLGAPRLSPRTTGPPLHGELSRNSSSRGCWTLIPQRIYHWGLQGADSLRASAKLRPFAAGLQAPARAKPGTRAAAVSRQQLLGCVEDCPSESQHPTQHQNHRHAAPQCFSDAECWLCCTFLRTESSWQVLRRKHELHCCYRKPKRSLSPGSAGEELLLPCSPWDAHQALSLPATQTTAPPYNSLHWVSNGKLQPASPFPRPLETEDRI